MTVLAVFRSRAQTMHFCSRLQQIGVAATAVNTPKEANVGCGLSARFDSSALNRAGYLLKTGRYTAFVGLYREERQYGRLRLVPL